MSQLAIRVEELGKQYRIGALQRTKRLHEAINDALLSPWRRLQRLGKPLPADEMIWALRDVSFEVQQGEVVGIIGRNGAGKSTLLKILSRITRPSTGRAELFGRVGSLLEVGTGFHPELTGRENIYLNGAILGMRKVEIDRKFDEIVAFSEIEKFIDTPVKRYSSGMYVRLAFAVAAHLEPEILLVDEVLAVGDLEFQRKCLGKMEDVSSTGRTILFVSHNIESIQMLCNRTIWIDQGGIREIGPSTKVVSEYISSKMNYTGSRTFDHLTIDRMHLCNRNGDIIDTIESGDSITLHIELSTEKSDFSMFCGIAVMSTHSELIYGTNSRDLGIPAFAIKDNSSIDIELMTNQLLAGRYYLWVQFSEAFGQILYDDRYALEFNVVGTQGVTNHISSGVGIVYIPSEWHYY